MSARVSGQLPLFGSQSVHLGHRGPVTGALECVMCRVSLALSAAWSGCDPCPGWVEPAPPWAVLGGAAKSELEHLAAKEAA